MANKLCQELLTTIFTECLANPPDSAPLREACRSGSSTAPRLPSPHGTLASAARVCKSWRDAATKVLYNDPGPSICRYEGLYLPHLIASLRKDPYLQNCVRSLSITASLEAGLWISNYACEGDLFCELLELCPELRGQLLISASCHTELIRVIHSCDSPFLRGSLQRPSARRSTEYAAALQLVVSLLTAAQAADLWSPSTFAFTWSPPAAIRALPS